ncbi:hypothetical protein [Bythopirellula polymerisocia]|uniref:Uncharacterized protein n=1 Tax=Bythopirellula polymerisocia TaxID=2528003 RepID=A0A5C6CAN2_9BACT|nr:hypothetical protein [Bythopirellula polymerisocia]TWU21278.1 hypothetical protein Pla144_46870 [Bythopirellula polymerisocia]
MTSDNSTPGLIARMVRVLLSRQAVRIYWIVNVALLLGLIVWICRDGKFSQAARLTAQLTPWNESNLQYGALPSHLATRVQILHAMITVGLVTAAGIMLSLFWGASPNRSIRSWLALMFALAAWLTLYTSWSDFAWRAQAWRMQTSLPAMEKLATTLLENWPSQDGQLPEIGPFNAYPIGKPRTLMLLTKPKPSGTSVQISTIERGEGDDLFFQLTDNDEGATLARFPQGSEPQAFFSGLEGEYQPVRHRALGQNWFLVQYIYVPILDSTEPRHTF